MVLRRCRLALLASALTALGAPARAESPADALARAVRPRPAPAATLQTVLSPRDPQAAARLPPGVARTAVDRRLGAGGLTGSLGFLCGLQPTPEVRGGAQALGVDDQGRYLGAKLRLAFH